MKILRTWPAKIPEGRNYVIDQLDKVVIQQYDMRFLSDLNDDIILLEWDIAVAQHDLYNFITHCNAVPHKIHVAPYVLYPESLHELESPQWAHRTMISELPLHMKWVDYGDPVCDIFSTGMIYLPGNICQEMADSHRLVTWESGINDSKLAFWHYQTYRTPVPIHWDVRPIHLHYDQERFYNGHPAASRVGDRKPSKSGVGQSIWIPTPDVGDSETLPTG